MSDQETIQTRAGIVLIAIVIVFALVLSVSSLDIPVRHDATGEADTTPVVEDWKGNSGSISK